MTSGHPDIADRRHAIITHHTDIIIIGAGLSGLSCASALIDKGYEFIIVEADHAVGGRIQTDEEDGYLFDRGFQVLQLAYPEALEMLDYKKLDVQRFPPGVRIRADGAFHVLADPLRCPAYALQTVFSRVGTYADRLKLARLAMTVSRAPLESMFEGKEQLALDYLVAYGFSRHMITQFFKPLMTGVCLDPNIQVTDRFLLFVLRMFAQGDVGVPARGMGKIPRQLAEKLPAGCLLLNERVESLQGTTVSLAGGGEVRGKAIVLATSGPEAARLTGRSFPYQSSRELCMYYSADQPPVKTGFLTLNGTGAGLINSVNFPSLVAAGYAPPKKYLISVIVPGYPDESETKIEQIVRKELEEWFGNQVQEWVLLRSYAIPHALPQPRPPTPNPYTTSCHLGNNIFDCSEMGTLPSIQWAFLAGRRGAVAVDAILKFCKNRGER